MQPTVRQGKLILLTRFSILDINDKSGELNYFIGFDHKSYTKPIIMDDNSIMIGYTNIFERRRLPKK